MKGFLLDTNIWIGLAHGESRLRQRLSGISAARIFSFRVVRSELMLGARKSQRVDENLTGFGELLQPFLSRVFDDDAAGHYGVVRAILEKAGTPVGANDLLIAAIAMVYDLVLVTRNSREFARVPGLRVDEW